MPMLERLEKIGAKHRVPSCRCCGGVLGIMDGITQAVREGVGIHTRCIVKHWDGHAKGKRAKRCKEFGATTALDTCLDIILSGVSNESDE